MEHSALSIFLKYAADWRKVFLFRLPECSLSFAKIMQTSAMRACSLIAECSLAYAKIMQGECNSKVGKLSFHNFDTAEPKLILCKDNANERKESLLSISRVQLILCKDNISDLHSQKYESKNESLPF